MEIQGRECEEIKIGEDKLYFLTSYKGKEYRKVINLQFSGNSELKDGELQFDAGKIIAGVPDLFPIFCIDIIKGEIHLTPNGEYLDNLEIKDYIKIQNILADKMNEVLTSKKD